jgi:hypothetical protein
MTEDEVRLAKLMLVLDGIGDIDLHERALEHAEKNGDLVAGLWITATQPETRLMRCP